MEAEPGVCRLVSHSTDAKVPYHSVTDIFQSDSLGQDVAEPPDDFLLEYALLSLVR